MAISPVRQGSCLVSVRDEGNAPESVRGHIYLSSQNTYFVSCQDNITPELLSRVTR